MAELTGSAQVFHSNTSIIDTSRQITLGIRGIDGQGNEYMYLQGIASVGEGSWVTYDEDYLGALLTADAIGPVAIAMAAITASEFGWFQVYGVNTVARTDTIAADRALYIDGTDGRVDDLGVSGDLVLGAYSMTADTSNVATVFIIYPHVSNVLTGTTFNDNETPSGTIDSTDGTDGNATFTLANTPITGSEHIYVNGARQESGSSRDYTISGLTITFVSGAHPLTNSRILADYRS